MAMTWNSRSRKTLGMVVWQNGGRRCLPVRCGPSATTKGFTGSFSRSLSSSRQQEVLRAVQPAPISCLMLDYVEKWRSLSLASSAAATSPFLFGSETRKVAWWASVTAAAAAISSMALFGVSSILTTTTNPCLCEGTTSMDTLKSTSAGKDDDDYGEMENPLWPSGIAMEDVDELIEEILQDPNMNIATIPDYVERQIYKSTILLMLNTLYESLSELHGEKLLGHEIHLVRRRLDANDTTSITTTDKNQRMMKRRSGDIDEGVLELLAEKMLANRNTNMRYVPDVLEKQLYVNCLKLIFRILDLLVSNFGITVCGHQISMYVHPMDAERWVEVQRQAVERVTSSNAFRTTEIQMENLRQWALQAGVPHDEDGNPIAVQAEQNENDNNKWFWQKRWEATQRVFMADLHACLYSVILGLMDDVFAHTEMHILSDTIQMDIVAPHERPSKKATNASSSAVVAVPNQKDVATATESSSTTNTSSAGLMKIAAGSFTVGMCTGAAAIYLAMGGGGGLFSPRGRG